MGLTYDGITYRSLEEQVRYDAEQVQLLKQADVTINENLQTMNTELNGKLTKPTTPTADSAITMLADGTVGTKPLSEIGGGGGGKLFRHDLTITADSYSLYTSIYISTNTEITAETLHNFILNNIYAHLGVTTQQSTGTVVSFGGQTRDTWGITMFAGLSNPVYFVPNQVIDTVTEL